jgi:4-alpha-glucanotransferase
MDNSIVRGAGVLCHISSLPNKYGIGSLGKEAYDFADFLKQAHVKYWQILPPVQTGYGDSPYQSVYCNSGNPYFIDLEALKEERLLNEEDLVEAQVEPSDKIDYGALYESRYKLLRLAYSRFDIKDKDFIGFIESGEFEDYALFMSLKSRYNCKFSELPTAYKYKETLAMFEFRKSVYQSEYCFWLFLQYEFFRQWDRLKRYVNSLGIKIIGDIPLYVAYDSADVWGKPELFQLDEDLNPVAVAGVPPDYFSKHGQLWGNPLYNWDTMEAGDYEWWVDRIARARKLYDVVRIDHFRGLDRYYSVPYGRDNAVIGEWKKGPGIKLFRAIQKKLGSVPIIAEDLGVIDAGVVKLREGAGLPGMKILQFAFDGTDDNEYLPQNIKENSIAYTGTHDNDTSLGFFEGMTDKEFATFKTRLRSALESEGVHYPFVSREDAVKALTVCTLATKARVAVIPVQDILLLGSSARMNTPATSEGNWQFRMTALPSRYHAGVLKKTIVAFER